MSDPRLTIYIPCYNAERHLPALFTALSNCPENIEILFIDDGSRDATPKLLAGFASGHELRRVVTHRKNMGPGGGCNSALDNARGLYLQRCDADDIPLWDGVLAALALVREGAPQLIAQAYYEVNRRGERALVGRDEYRTTSNPLAALWVGAAPSLPATMLPLAVIKRIGCRFPTLDFGEDHLWLLRLYMEAPELKAVVSDVPSYEYIHQEASLANFSSASASGFVRRYRAYFAALEALCYEARKLGLVSEEEEGMPLVQRAGDLMRAMRKSGQPIDALCTYRSIATRFGVSRPMRRERLRNLMGLPFFGLIR